jgi:hypothetical protein
MVELGGIREAVTTRIDLLRAIADGLGSATQVRLAVIGFRDHFGEHRAGELSAEHEALLVGCGMSQVPGALSALAKPERWRAVPVRDNSAAPLEDALNLIAQPDWKWRPEARHVLVVVGSRPPHPPKVDSSGGLMLPCPHRYSWQKALERLRSQHAIECLSVLDKRACYGPEGSYADHAWRQISPGNRLVQADTGPGRLTRMLRLTTGGDSQLSLAMRTTVAPRAGVEERR